MNSKYIVKTRNLIRKELLAIIKKEVQPLTNLPIEHTLETDIEDGHFYASGSIGHPNFGYFGYVMNGLIVDFLKSPISIVRDQFKAFLYPVKNEGNQISLNAEATPFFTENINAAALTSNKLLFVNAICNTAVPEDNLDILAKNINTVITGMLNGFI